MPEQLGPTIWMLLARAASMIRFSISLPSGPLSPMPAVMMITPLAPKSARVFHGLRDQLARDDDHGQVQRRGYSPLRCDGPDG